MLKNLLYTCLNFFISLLIGNLFITILSYFNILNNSTINILTFIYPLIIIIINSYLLGKKAIKKGFLEGLKLSSIIVTVFLIITLFTNNYKNKILIYYLILLISSIISSSIGINKQERNT